mgnify:CR=1 FL=1
MDTQTMAARPLEFILSEANGNYSRDAITVLSGQNLAAGTVLGKVTASGKFKAATASGSDGGQTAVAVLAYAVDASAGDAAGVAITRVAEVNADLLVFGATIDDGTKEAAAITQLAAVGIIAR